MTTWSMLVIQAPSGLLPRRLGAADNDLTEFRVSGHAVTTRSRGTGVI